MNTNNLTSSLIFPGDKLSYGTVVAKAEEAKSNGYYTVTLGDTLGKISRNLGVSVNDLVQYNLISNPNLIFVGQVLKTQSEQVKVDNKVVETPEVKPVSLDVVKEESKPKPTVMNATVAPKPVPEVVQKEVKKEEVKPVETKKVEKEVPKKKAEEEEVQVKKDEPKQVAPVAGDKASAIYNAALAQIGKIQDCTMLVTNALKSVGINFHDWPAGYMSLGTVVPASEAVPGDLIYYPDGGLGVAHIGVYAGNGQAVHGGWQGNQTVLNTANVGHGATYIRVR